jgi:hypothetical protein
LGSWLNDHVMVRSKLGESLSLALISAGHQRAALIREEGAQRNGHTPSLDSSNATPVAWDKHDH